MDAKMYFKKKIIFFVQTNIVIKIVFRIQIIFIMLNVVKDVGIREIILIGNRKIKQQRICHDVKTANFNGRKFKWGYSITQMKTQHAY